MQEAEKCVESRAITDVHTAHAMVHLVMVIYSKGQAWRSFCCITSNNTFLLSTGWGWGAQCGGVLPGYGYVHSVGRGIRIRCLSGCLLV